MRTELRLPRLDATRAPYSAVNGNALHPYKKWQYGARSWVLCQKHQHHRHPGLVRISLILDSNSRDELRPSILQSAIADVLTGLSIIRGPAMVVAFSMHGDGVPGEIYLVAEDIE